MHALLIYLLKVAVTLGAMVIFYQLFLSRMTFYRANRFFLLAASFISFVLPWMDAGLLLDNTASVEPVLVSWVPATEALTSRFIATAQSNDTPHQFTPVNWITTGWLVGVVLLAIRLMLSVISLARLRHRSSVRLVNGSRVYVMNRNIVPFSFGGSIFIPESAPGTPQLEQIISHESVHVRQHHTVDMMIAEFTCIMQWFNPFAWLLRKSIRQNLEFIADHHVISTGVGPQEYQMLLLNVMGRRSYGITSQFNLSSLKNRIIMMNKNRNSRAQLLRFTIILPLAAIIFLSFRSLNRPPVGTLDYSSVVLDVNTRKPVEGVVMHDLESGKETITGTNGQASLVFEGAAKRKLRLVYSKKGYSNVMSTVTVGTKENQYARITELVAIAQGAPSAPCADCFTAFFADDELFRANPVKVLEQHLANKAGQGTTLKASAVRSGSIEVSTDGQITLSDRNPAMTTEGKVTFRSPGDSMHPLVVLDGRQMTWLELKALTDTTRAGSLDPGQISSVRILNKADALKEYGSKAADGVIIIETKEKQ